MTVTFEEIRTTVQERESAQKEYFADPNNKDKEARFRAACQASRELKERNGGPLYGYYSN